MRYVTEPLHGIGDAISSLEPPVPAEVERFIVDLAGHGAGDVTVNLEKLGRGHRVCRVRIAANGEERSIVLKRVDPQVAERNRLVSRRWLPWLGLDGVAPKLLATAAAPGADAVWQIHEDVSGPTLHERRSERDRVAAAVELIAELHTRAGGQPLTAECRRAGQDLGVHFFTSNVSDASRLLDALRPPRVQPSRDQAAVRDRLRRRLERLLGDTGRRTRPMAQADVPETMLHGDLWTTNILLQAGGGHRVWLVDWDRVGAGHFGYDLSVLLYRFPARERRWIVGRYRDAVAKAGWRLPPAAELNVLFDTFERARYANRIVWAGLALLREGSAWGWDELAEIERWFRMLRPALQDARTDDAMAHRERG